MKDSRDDQQKVESKEGIEDGDQVVDRESDVSSKEPGTGRVSLVGDPIFGFPP